MSRYREADLRGVRTYPVAARASKVDQASLYRPPGDPDSFAEYWRSLPDQLAARDLRELVGRVLAARRGGHGVLALLGAHVIKTGMGPGLIQLMREGWITGLAMNGATVIHDLELAFFGRTSEDVASQLPQGRFGMARETSEWLNEWTRVAAERNEGLGEGLGRAFREQGAPFVEHSLLAAAYELGIPATVHLSIGTDINHQHPGFPGAAAGDASARDFRILVAVVQTLGRGVALNLGSAVLMPEVFLKAVSVAVNLGTPFENLTAAVFDFQKHYRPLENVVRRPTSTGGWGTYIVGHHEVILPLFFQAIRSQAKSTKSTISQEDTDPRR
ncbi:MAG: hypothetical protein R3E12_08335 [Candidatus Eisenbacteria bacterium]|uniref:Deoxyhypusine synthase n=1 Tax=Eiseniibacteriota bacterium TaxID=2212470 RepID=A0A956RPZ4_UNCEI|nr:hypothetical protein [Candidatus Eisenbacteria bacterium]